MRGASCGYEERLANESSLARFLLPTHSAASIPHGALEGAQKPPIVLEATAVRQFSAEHVPSPPPCGRPRRSAAAGGSSPQQPAAAIQQQAVRTQKHSARCQPAGVRACVRPCLAVAHGCWSCHAWPPPGRLRRVKRLSTQPSADRRLDTHASCPNRPSWPFPTARAVLSLVFTTALGASDTRKAHDASHLNRHLVPARHRHLQFCTVFSDPHLRGSILERWQTQETNAS